MPVITRNQRKNIVKIAAKPVVTSNSSQAAILHIAPQYIEKSKLFIDELKILLVYCEMAVGKEDKMKMALEIFNTINRNLQKIIEDEGVEKWIRFVSTIYDKIIELEADYLTNSWNVVDKKLVEIFRNELEISKNFVVNIVKNYNGELWKNLISLTKEKIANSESHRSRRNIPRVDYTGMDTIEPESEFDGITDIWADLTIQEDPNYEFEEDEDDEEDRRRWAKIHPELSSAEKAELKQHLSELVEHHRVRRNIARVNYTGMDMNEEDVGQIHVAKRWFENGKVKYIWKSYSLSEANEIGDEDYVDEE